MSGELLPLPAKSNFAVPHNEPRRISRIRPRPVSLSLRYLIGQCTTSQNCVKIVTRHVWQDYKDEVNSHRYEDYGKAVYKRRKETVERSFADGKELHGHRYARFRGLSKVQAQCLLSAACQNMKKIALLAWRKGHTPPNPHIATGKTLIVSTFPALKRLFAPMPLFPSAA